MDCDEARLFACPSDFDWDPGPPPLSLSLGAPVVPGAFLLLVFTARRYDSAVYAMALCPSLRLSRTLVFLFLSPGAPVVLGTRLFLRFFVTDMTSSLFTFRALAQLPKMPYCLEIEIRNDNTNLPNTHSRTSSLCVNIIRIVCIKCY